MTALNPTMRVGDQVAEAMLIHRHRVRPRRRAAAAVELLEQVRLPDRRRLPARTRTSCPAASGSGWCSRIALANDPALLICDEPTTALDVTVQALVLDLIVTGVEARGAALLFITHDLAVVATVCERVLVMYGGRIVEAGPVARCSRARATATPQGLLAASDLEHGRAGPAAHDPGLRARRRAVPGRLRVPQPLPPSPPTSAPTAPAWSGSDARPAIACHHPGRRLHHV